MQNFTIITLKKFRHRKKIASFDYDWTLVKPKTKGIFPKNIDDWEWLYKNIPEKIKNYYDKGYAILVFTNQSKDWKIEQIKKVLSLLNIPIFIAIATNRNNYKPNKLIFNEYDKKYGHNKYDKVSFYCGDALGRENDWADIDKRFAINIGLQIKSPEEIFM